jgi:hypothetical protein
MVKKNLIQISELNIFKMASFSLRFWVDWQGDNPVPDVVDFMKKNYGKYLFFKKRFKN